VFRADRDADAFFCSKCNKVYTLDQVLDDVLDTAAKPGTSPGVRVKMVPLSRSLQTYHVKDEIKALGGKWDHINKQWMVPETAFAAAHSVIQRGPKNVTPPVSGATFTTSRFAGLADDMTFEEYQRMSWSDYNARQRTAPHPTSLAVVKRACWECAKQFTEPEFGSRRGSWEDYWCGCEGR